MPGLRKEGDHLEEKLADGTSDEGRSGPERT
jgi:hypothetical protein